MATVSAILINLISWRLSVGFETFNIFMTLFRRECMIAEPEWSAILPLKFLWHEAPELALLILFC